MTGKRTVKEVGLGEIECRALQRVVRALKGKYAEDAFKGWELSCRVVNGTGTKWIVGLCGNVVNSSEVD